MILVRLSGPGITVDVRVLERGGRWIASVDTPIGPSLGLGFAAEEAIEGALEPYQDQIAALLGSLHRGELT